MFRLDSSPPSPQPSRLLISWLVVCWGVWAGGTTGARSGLFPMEHSQAPMQQNQIILPELANGTHYCTPQNLGMFTDHHTHIRPYHNRPGEKLMLHYGLPALCPKSQTVKDRKMSKPKAQARNNLYFITLGDQFLCVPSPFLSIPSSDQRTYKDAFVDSAFVNTIFPVRDNSTKSFIFRVAEILLLFAIWNLFSLLAAVQNRFTSFAVFSESLVQKAYFVWSRGLSKDALLVSSFAVMYAAAQLYGTLLWAMDAPGFITQTRQVAASSTLSSLLDNLEYIVSYKITPDSLKVTDAQLAEILSVNLFRPGTNATLTGSFDQGMPEVVPNPRPEGVPRIWLDDEG